MALLFQNYSQFFLYPIIPQNYSGIIEACLKFKSTLICLMCWRCYTKMVTLQEEWMKDWVSQAGMLSCARFACGTSFLNLSCWKWDKQSAVLLLAPAILYLAAQKYSKWTEAMVSLARVEPDCHIHITAWLSQWIKILCLCQSAPQVCAATYYNYKLYLQLCSRPI